MKSQYKRNRLFKLAVGSIKLALIASVCGFTINMLSSSRVFACSMTETGDNPLNSACVPYDLPADVGNALEQFDHNTVDSSCYNGTPKFYTTVTPWISESGVPQNDNDIVVPANDPSYPLQLNEVIFLCNQMVSTAGPGSPVTQFTLPDTPPPTNPGATAGFYSNLGIPNGSSLLETTSETFIKTISITSVPAVGSVSGIQPSNTDGSDPLFSIASAGQSSRFWFTSTGGLVYDAPATPGTYPITVTAELFPINHFSDGDWDCVNGDLEIGGPQDWSSCTASPVKISFNIQVTAPVVTLYGIVSSDGIPQSGVTVQACDCDDHCEAADGDATKGSGTTGTDGQYSLTVYYDEDTCISVASGAPPGSPGVNESPGYPYKGGEYTLIPVPYDVPTTGWNFSYTSQPVIPSPTNPKVSIQVTGSSCTTLTVTAQYPTDNTAGNPSYVTVILSGSADGNPVNAQEDNSVDYGGKGYQTNTPSAGLSTDNLFSFTQPQYPQYFNSGTFTLQVVWTDDTATSDPITLTCPQPLSPPQIEPTFSCTGITGTVTQDIGDTEPITVTLTNPDGTQPPPEAVDMTSGSGTGTFTVFNDGNDPNFGAYTYANPAGFTVVASNAEGSSAPISMNIGACGNIQIPPGTGTGPSPTPVVACTIYNLGAALVEANNTVTEGWNLGYDENGTSNATGFTYPVLSGTITVSISLDGAPVSGQTQTINYDEPTNPGDNYFYTPDQQYTNTETALGNYTATLTFTNGLFDNGTYQGTLPDQTCTSSFIVANKPYLRVYGGDVTAGNGFTGASGSCTQNTAGIETWNEDAATQYSGSGTQLAAQATGAIQGFVSNDELDGAPPPILPQGLSFANTTNVAGDAYGGELGGGVNLPCIPDYYDANVSTAAANYYCPNTITITNGIIPAGDCTLTSTGTTGAVNLTTLSSPTVVKINGDTYITGLGPGYNTSSTWVTTSSTTTTIPPSYPTATISNSFQAGWVTAGSASPITSSQHDQLTTGAVDVSGANGAYGGRGCGNSETPVIGIYGCAGSIFYTTPFSTTASDLASFTVSFDANFDQPSSGITSTDGLVGADGISLVMADAAANNPTSPTGILGLGGCGDGSNGIPASSGKNSLSLYLDTYQNTADSDGDGGYTDPSSNFFGSEFTNLQSFNPATVCDNYDFFEQNIDGYYLTKTPSVPVTATYCKIVYAPTCAIANSFTINVSGQAPYSIYPITLPPNVYFGFTAGTGGAAQVHGVSLIPGTPLITETTVVPGSTTTTTVSNPDSLNVPSLWIISKGNIYIDPSTNSSANPSAPSMSGVYIAQQNATNTGGTIYTCSDGPGTIATSAATFDSTCDTQLIVDGALVANQIEFGRTFGTTDVGTAGDTSYNQGNGWKNSAEIVNYTPDVWLENPFTSNQGLYEAISSLPPVL